MFLEVVKVSELENMGVPASKRTVMMSHPEVYEDHLKASDYELEYALEKRTLNG